MNDFDVWNEFKKGIETGKGTQSRFPKEGEVGMSSLGRNIGFEQNGNGDNFSRPVLVIKKFNNNMFWIVPLSTKQKGMDFYFNYIDPSGKRVSAILAQLKLMSIKRIKRKMYDLDKEKLKEINVKLKSFL
jgi:mRNA interferase MazF